VLLSVGDGVVGRDVTGRFPAMSRAGMRTHRAKPGQVKPDAGSIVGGTDMLMMIPQFTIDATGLMAISLLMSGLGILILVLASSIYVCRVTASGISSTFDTGIAAFGCVVSKLWMTSMLPMVALYNGIGGGAAGAFAAGELFGNKTAGATRLIVTLAGALMGAVSLSGSAVAWTKLIGFVDKPLRVRGQRAFSLAIAVTALAAGAYVVCTTQSGTDGMIATPGLIYLLFGCALLFGALMTLPAGRAQMPVMISIYNGFTGLAVGLEGFVLRSPMLMIAGVAVGTVRMLLTLQMTKR
jgi:NAD(P) transhydrogenase subunit beta